MDVQSDSHDALLRAVRSGRPEALDALLSVYRNYLTLLARTQINIRMQPRIDPSDLAQEALLEAYRGFDTFCGQTSQELIVWLRQILVRKLVDRVRHAQAQKRDLRREESLAAAMEQSSQVLLRAFNSHVSSPSTQVSKQEQSVLLADALERLPRDYREVIMLRQFEQLSFGDVAKRLNRSSGAVRMLFARAIDRLRQELDEVPR